MKCKEAGASCIERRNGVALDPTRAGSFSYVESLEARVRQLEQDVSVEGVVNDTAMPAVQPEAPRQPAAQDVDTAMQDMHYLPLSAMAEPREQQQTSLHRLSFKSFVLAATSVSGANPTSSERCHGSVAQDFHRDAPASVMPSNETADLSIQRYIDCCRVMCPYMDPSAFRAVCQKVLPRDRSSNESVDVATTREERATVNVAIATGILLSGDQRYEATLAAGLANKALDDIPRVLGLCTNAAVVRYLISLAIHSMYSPLCGSTWHILGLATARAFSAGLHTDDVSNWQSDDPQKQDNSRLFWGLYILDG